MNRTPIALIIAGLVALAIIVIGSAYLALNPPNKEPSMLTLTSAAFREGESIPVPYTCDSTNVSPPLSISGIPKDTKSMVLVMDDPDVPKELKPDGLFVHWILYAMPPDTKEIPEGSIAGDTGLNGAGKDMYTGPCPPPEYAPTEHRYFFKLYALDNTPTFAATPSREEILAAIDGHVIESAELMGTYDRAVR